MDPLEPPFILSLDVGTSSTRALLFDRHGQPLLDTLIRQEYHIDGQPGGVVETDADTLLQIIWAAIDQTLAQAGRDTEGIVGVTCCTFAGSTLPLDEHSRPLTPLWLYSDNRAAEDAQFLRERLDGPASHQRTGVPFHPGYQPARILWFHRRHPDIFQKTTRWVTLGEYMGFKLFGDLAVSTSIASWTGLLNVNRLEWDSELLDALPISSGSLSPLVDASQAWTDLLPAYRQRWPALARVPWFPAIGDGAAANLGSGCCTSDQVAITIGTSSATRAIFEGTVPRFPDGIWCYRVDQHRLVLGGALNEGGSVYSWLTDLLHLPVSAQLEQELRALPADSGGVTILPFINGERSPGWHGDARAMIAGLNLSTTPEQILQAGLEAVAFRIAALVDLLQPLLPHEPNIITTGGALQNSPAWTHILADILGRPLIESRALEASARGTALLGLEALGLLKDICAAPPEYGPVVAVDPGRHARYEAARRRHQALYDQFISQ